MGNAKRGAYVRLPEYYARRVAEIGAERGSKISATITAIVVAQIDRIDRSEKKKENRK